MKIFMSFIIMLMFTKECEQKKDANMSETASSMDKTETIPQEDMSISYQAVSRGFFEKIWVSKDSISYTNDRDMKQKISSQIAESDWSELMKLLQAVDLEKIPDLKAPTEMRFYDGAAIATFSVEKKQGVIESSDFDHGHPPKAIEALVNKVLSMKENIQKQ